MQFSEERVDGRSPQLLPPIAETEALKSTESCVTMQPSEERVEGRSPRLLPPIAETEALMSSVCEYTASVEVAPRPNHLRLKMFSSGGCFGSSSSARSRRSDRESREEHAVLKFLDSHKEFLETYLVQNVPLEVLEDVIFRKIKYHYVDDEASPSSRYAKYKREPKKACFNSLVKKLKDCHNEDTLVWELAKSITNAVTVDAFRVFKMYPDSTEPVQCFITDGKNLLHSPSGTQLEVITENDQVQLALEAAKKKCCIRSARLENPFRFPDTPTSLFKLMKQGNVEQADHIFYQPILLANGKTGYVIEMWRVKDRFGHKDEEISSHYVLWGSIALYFCKIFLERRKERNTTEFLLDFVKSTFEDMVSLDQLIKRILEFAQRLVDADRASMFLVDSKSQELVSTVFDLKFEACHEIPQTKSEIRMPIDRGIAGHVALSGETMNIPDAYADYRFNRQVDDATGYKTKSILCMPIKVEGKVIGVVQMVNKRTMKSFDQEDEIAFEVFSTFFGLAVHNARLYDRIKRKEQKYKVALEVLSYHNTCKDQEVEQLLSSRVNTSKACQINCFKLDPTELNDVQKSKAIIKMFGELFPMNNFNIKTLARFVLTVKKNYRTVPYHNFDHGWSVAHAMYYILKCDYKGRFNYHRRLALFVASLCHDLDHRGYTNKYMSETASPLAAMYTTSTLEHHHFNSTVTILQQDGHNIFSNISSEDYKKVLGYIRHAILATDLAAFFPNLAKMKQLQDPNNEEKFDWDNPSHCDLAMAIAMTAADLSASAKPWKVQIKTVKVIFEEFYAQGDKEKKAGRNPIPMMDRYKPEEQPASQVGFLSQICLPCYSVLYSILPRTYEMFQMAKSNLDYWETRSKNIKDPKNAEGLYTRLYDVTKIKSKIIPPDLPVRQIMDAGDDLDIFEMVNLDTPDQSLVEKYRKCINIHKLVEDEEPIDTTTTDSENRSTGLPEEGECSKWMDINRVTINIPTQTNIDIDTISDNSEYDDCLN